jgi:hypothetical protein
MKMASIVTTLATLAVALASAGVASADPDYKFLATLRKGGFSWTNEAGGQTLIDSAHQLCAGLESGANAADIITAGVKETGWSGTQVGYFVGAAASQYCPQHLKRALAEASTLDG